MKTITITVQISTGNPQTLTIQVPITTTNPQGIPNLSEWEQILAFQDDHVGGRPKDR